MNKKIENDRYLVWSVEVYSIKDSKDLLVFQFDEDPGEAIAAGGYFASRISFDKIVENLSCIYDDDDLVSIETKEISSEIIDDSEIDDFYFSPDEPMGKVYLKDVVNETGIELKDYLCGFDSSYYYEAVVRGLHIVDKSNSLEDILSAATERSKSNVDFYKESKSDVEIAKEYY